MKTRHGSGDIGGIPINYHETELDAQDYEEMDQAICSVGSAIWSGVKTVAKIAGVATVVGITAHALSDDD